MNVALEGPMTPYRDGADYAEDHLYLLGLRLQREVLRFRLRRGDRSEQFLGLFISDDDVDEALAEVLGLVSEGEAADMDALGATIEQFIRIMQQRLKASSGLLPHQRLSQAFGLGPVAMELIYLALAREVDSRFGKVFGFLHDDVARKQPSAEITRSLLNLRDVTGARMHGESLRQALQNSAPLRRFELLHLADNERLPLLSRGLYLDERMANYLLSVACMDEQLAPCLCEPWQPAGLALSEDASTLSAQDLARRWRDEPRPLILDTRTAGDANLWLTFFCSEAGRGRLDMDTERLSKSSTAALSSTLIRAVREAHLTESLLVLNKPGLLAPDALKQLMDTRSPLVCLSLAAGDELTEPRLGDQETYRVQPPSVNRHNRLAVLKSCLPAPYAEETDLLRLVERYPVSSGRARDLCRQALDEFSPTLEPVALRLERLFRREAGRRMGEVAERVDLPFTLDDLILTPATHCRLQQLIQRQDHQHRVLQDWGLAQLYQQREGMAALFAGPSGSGKTMAAGVLANALGLDMYRIDLANVVSKYIGETEKNLERVFSVARSARIVLFIDEADALFGKRSEVKDAHDRYANLEVSYLLQKMEDHPGVVVLASNLDQNIDDAFLRRFTAVLEFAPPGRRERLLLWQKLRNGRLPLGEDVDLEFLAERFELSGGHIKNCVISAAYQAAATHGTVDMLLLIQAIAQEYTKLGRPVSKAGFAQYYDGLRRLGEM